MAIKVKVMVRDNHITKEKVASAMIVDLQSMDFAEFCDYLAQDSTVGPADVAAVMTQLEKKLPCCSPSVPRCRSPRRACR